MISNINDAEKHPEEKIMDDARELFREAQAAHKDRPDQALMEVCGELAKARARVKELGGNA